MSVPSELVKLFVAPFEALIVYPEGDSRRLQTHSAVVSNVQLF